MKFRSLPRWVVWLWCGALSALPLHAQENPTVTPAAVSDEPGKPGEANTKSLPWLSNLAERRPMLVRVGAVWCPSCRVLEAEIEKPAVQTELDRWVPVYLDADRSEKDARALNVAVVPALRIRTATGS